VRAVSALPEQQLTALVLGVSVDQPGGLPQCYQLLLDGTSFLKYAGVQKKDTCHQLERDGKLIRQGLSSNDDQGL
jgi:hypothetical protein